MKTLVKFWKAESALIVACIVALAGVITLPGPWAKVLGVLLPLLGGGAVRRTVWAPDSHQAAVQAAVQAALAIVMPPPTVPVPPVTPPAPS